MKLLAQMTGVLILLSFGVGVKLPLPDLLNYALTLVWIVGITNAVNFLDNRDGLCAGVCAVASAFIVLIAAIHGQHLVAALAAVVLGACVGFLRYNFKPATIFMGDAGSLVFAVAQLISSGNGPLPPPVPQFSSPDPSFDTLFEPRCISLP